jgi:hypothetical protein
MMTYTWKECHSGTVNLVMQWNKPLSTGSAGEVKCRITGMTCQLCPECDDAVCVLVNFLDVWGGTIRERRKDSDLQVRGEII